MKAQRRTFLVSSAAMTLAAAMPKPRRASAQSPDRPAKRSIPLCVFTKPLTSLSFDDLAARVADLGFDGLEAPVRPRGHVEPKDAAQKLPKLVKALQKRDLEITVLTSAINNADDATNRELLKVAADLGVRRYRLGYFKYDLSKPIVPQLDRWKEKLIDLAELNEQLGICGLYQNHAGRNTMGAPVWDLRYILNGIDPKDLAVAYDIRHATVEGGTSWPLTFQLIRPHIDTVYVKDFDWDGTKVINVPLGQGMVDPAFFKMLAESEFSGPVSLHEEYLDHADPALVPKHIDAIRDDLATLDRWMTDAGI
ncbi:sugar phosphate isomerase/epimerase family protein [Crateriforma conspicua]|uniref:Xylose isomerase-like TIM barrel n=1 Tax=Crateriforma conspicua TaxID=2527996 RepID=A0A5C5XQK5_9PLAN|nr:sugar phosphate isomerase/epimerase family protein [Crateriforma conspicua]TWT65496.1 Xylose isomerase-like TIM barrel [Crateriforma conspicua]